MDEIKIGAEIVFNITGNHNIGYAKWERYIGTVLSKEISESGLWWFVRIATIIPKREHKEVRMSFD